MPRSANSASRRRAFIATVLLLAMAGAWAWRLTRPAPVPVATAMDEARRLEQLKLVAAYLAKAPKQVVGPILAGLPHVSDERLAVLHEWVQDTPDQQLRELTVLDGLPLDQKAREALLISWLGQENLPPPLESHLMIAAAGNHVGDDMKLYALQTLARRADKAGQPRAAITILDRALKLPNATWETVTALVAAGRNGGDLGSACAAVGAWAHRPKAEDGDPDVEAARDLEVALLLESNRAHDALGTQLEALKSAPGGIVPFSVLERAFQCAQAAHEEALLLPYLERCLARFPEHRLDWRELLTAKAVTPDYRRWLSRLTGIAEMHWPAGRVFEWCRRLAACGEAAALPRLCAAAEAVRNDAECREFLLAAAEHAELLPAILDAARQYRFVKRCVDSILRAHPDHRDLHFAASLADAAASEAGTAAVTWMSFLRQFPEDEAGLRRLAQCHLINRQHAMALRALERIGADRRNDEDRQYLTVLRQM